MKMLLPLLLVSGLAIADDAVLLRCRTIADANDRLACYDALVMSPPGSASGVKGSVALQPSPAAQAQAAQRHRPWPNLKPATAVATFSYKTSGTRKGKSVVGIANSNRRTMNFS